MSSGKKKLCFIYQMFALLGPGNLKDPQLFRIQALTYYRSFQSLVSLHTNLNLLKKCLYYSLKCTVTSTSPRCTGNTILNKFTCKRMQNSGTGTVLKKTGSRKPEVGSWKLLFCFHQASRLCKWLSRAQKWFCSKIYRHSASQVMGFSFR